MYVYRLRPHAIRYISKTQKVIFAEKLSYIVFSNTMIESLVPDKMWNVIKAEVWARLTAIWALPPLSHNIVWIFPLKISTYLPSKNLARPSLIVPNGLQAVQNEIAKTQFLRFIDFPINNEGFLMFYERTNKFSDSENIGKGISHSETRVLISSTGNPK